MVGDVLHSLQMLAAYHRKKTGLPIIAVTGSNGKTTTKELTAAVLSQKYKITYTKENLNNHIGVPLTLLEMTEKTDLGIVEMGANHPGEIEALCKIADPDYGIITNIGRAHLEGFGSFEGIKQTKAELYKYISAKNGTVFYNSDDLILRELSRELQGKVSYGSSGADVIGEPLSVPPYLHVRISFPENLYIKTGLTGMYNFYNVMAAACIGRYFGVAPARIAGAIENYIPENNRSQIIKKGDLTIVMDAYNANPASMQAAIESFVSGFSGTKCLILGDMLELGQYTEQEHTNILKKIAEYPFKEVLLVGPAFLSVSKDFPFKTFTDTTNLCHYLNDHKPVNCALLIKGSRGIKLEKVLEFL